MVVTGAGVRSRRRLAADCPPASRARPSAALPAVEVASLRFEDAVHRVAKMLAMHQAHGSPRNEHRKYRPHRSPSAVTLRPTSWPHDGEHTELVCDDTHWHLLKTASSIY